MSLADYVLYQAASHWPSPVAKLVESLGGDVESDAYQMAYALRQYNEKVRNGVAVSPLGLDVLEIGCGHGGITCYLGAVGAKSVLGIDLNTKHLGVAERFIAKINEQLGRPLPITFSEMDASALAIPNDSIDLILADNVFEHFMCHEQVLAECMRVLRPGGKLLVPAFPSIYSKHGLHLKHGLKLPWANLVFSEKTICRALVRLAEDNPKLYETYPGLRNNPTKVRDVRRYGDLNGMTYGRFRKDAQAAGFKIEWFRVTPTRVGRLFNRVPVVKNSLVMDVLSKGGSCLLVKPGQKASDANQATTSQLESASV